MEVPRISTFYHLFSFDGVCEKEPDGTVVLRRALTPQRWQVQELVERIATRVRAMVARARARSVEEEVLTPALELMGTSPDERPTPELVAEHDGFDLHTSVAFEAEEQVALERFCRHAFRGVITQDRLSRGPNDMVVYRMKSLLTRVVLVADHCPQAMIVRAKWGGQASGLTRVPRRRNIGDRPQKGNCRSVAIECIWLPNVMRCRSTLPQVTFCGQQALQVEI